MKRMLILLCATLFLATIPSLAAPAQASESAAQAVVQETNWERTKRGLPALTTSPELTAAAKIRAREIVKKFSHTRPNGDKWLTVSDKARGENIAKGQQTVNKVMAAWMTSEGHKRNILRPTFKTIGVSAYKINNIWYWVQLFGTR